MWASHEKRLPPRSGPEREARQQPTSISRAGGGLSHSEKGYSDGRIDRGLYRGESGVNRRLRCQ